MPDVYIGKPWNTDMATVIEDWRTCANCGTESRVRIYADEEGEYWTCPRGGCKAKNEKLATKGKYGGTKSLVEGKTIKPDRTKELSDFKRNTPRKYLPRENTKKKSRKKRKEILK